MGEKIYIKSSSVYHYNLKFCKETKLKDQNSFILYSFVYLALTAVLYSFLKTDLLDVKQLN